IVMLTISVWNRKGGIGKSNTAINVAGWFAAQGRKTSLVDLDPQGGAMIFAGYAKQNGRELPFHVGRKPAPDSDYIIFDHSPGVNSGGALGSFVIVPTILDAA
ncbi:ParA family protein, partial [Klebsiella pneumoniae]|uniref:ParA family protein n=1 Tax=Klebsiella pneumoniae TaxID=573 RepID=UPI002246CB80